jgi:hypothetical protein
MVNEKEIFEFYNSEDFKPELPEDVSRRHFRFKLANKYWKKVRETIRDKDDLIRNIFKLGGCDLYYSTSKWMNPTKISTKGGSGTYMVADNLLLGNDLVFDIDAEEPITQKGLDLARKSANNLYLLMKAHPEYKFQYFAFTGYKGFRLAYKDTTELPADSRYRIDNVEKNRKVFIDVLLNEFKEKRSLANMYKLEPFFDKKITVNAMCVVRILGTVHSTTGYISTKLPLSYMRKPIKEVLDYVPYVGKKRPGIPKREMTEEVGDDVSSPCPRLLISEDDATGLASLPYISDHTYFITNKVLGIKRGFIPIFIYQKNQEYYRKELLKLQKKYKLGDLYVFDHDGDKVAISLKTCQRRRLQRILNDSSSKTKRDFMKHRRIFAPFVMKFEEKIHSDNYITWLSKGHFHYVEPNGGYSNRNFCGWEKIEMIKAIRGDNNG